MRMRFQDHPGKILDVTNFERSEKVQQPNADPGMKGQVEPVEDEDEPIMSSEREPGAPETIKRLSPGQHFDATARANSSLPPLPSTDRMTPGERFDAAVKFNATLRARPGRR